MDGGRQALYQRPLHDSQPSSMTHTGVFLAPGRRATPEQGARRLPVIEHSTRACFLAASRIARRLSHSAAYFDVKPVLVGCDPSRSLVGCGVASGVANRHIPTAPVLETLWVLPNSAEGEGPVYLVGVAKLQAHL